MVKMKEEFLTNEMTAEQVLEKETAGNSCQHRFKYGGGSTCRIKGEVNAEQYEN